MIPKSITANEVRTGDLIKVTYRGALLAFNVLSRKLTCGGSQVDLELAERGKAGADVHKILGCSSHVILLER